MFATVRALLEKLIDYAGMFPPARLPMGEALHHYTRLAKTPEAWMLGRFVCQASRLGELLLTTREQGVPRPSRIVALGRGGRDSDEFRNNLAVDLEDTEALRRSTYRKSIADVLELIVPPSGSADELSQLLDEVLPVFANDKLRAFLEAPSGPTWQRDVQTICQCLVKLKATGWPDLRGLVATTDHPLMVGLKIRCGGAAIPSVEQLAFFIARCRENRLAWKATAGLHHPLRHRDPATQTMVHGFLNVFLAGIFAHVHALDEPQLAALLQEESVDVFRFTDEHIGWRDWSCTVDQVREARAWLPSFGSCSFDEPRDDLRALGLIA